MSFLFSSLETEPPIFRLAHGHLEQRLHFPASLTARYGWPSSSQWDGTWNSIWDSQEGSLKGRCLPFLTISIPLTCLPPSYWLACGNGNWITTNHELEWRQGQTRCRRLDPCCCRVSFSPTMLTYKLQLCGREITPFLSHFVLGFLSLTAESNPNGHKGSG